MTDVWNNVTVYGPAAEIQRFKRECLDMELDECRVGQSGWTGCKCDISLPKAQEGETSWIP